MRVGKTLGLVTATGCFVAGIAWYLHRHVPAPPVESAGEYVSASTCRSCHEGKHRSYQHVGMARSFASLTASDVSKYAERQTYRHATSGRSYEVVRRDGKLYQRRYELDASGRAVNDFELQATHVVGSGNHARTYLHRLPSGELVELPLSWYAETGTWAMSPGYDRANPPDFTRIADESCLFCHNGYPAPDGALANGIDCQRCHGPGGSHVRAASQPQTPRDTVRALIVNPARLSPELQMDVCMQCHLETTSSELPQMLRRLDQDVFSYRPGKPLGNYMVHFDHAPGAGRDDKFEIVNQAYRLRKSACFLKSGGKLTCTSCHDPHSVPRGESAAAYYRAQCVKCHATVQTPSHPALANADCRGCHMPRRRAEDAVHTVMTDHLVQRKVTGGLLRPLEEQTDVYTGDLAIYYPAPLEERERDLYLGTALASRSTHRAQGLALLERAVTADAPARAHAVLGEAYLAAGRHDDAIRAFTAALGKQPNLPKARYNLGQAFEAAGSPDRARTEYATAAPLPEAEFAIGNLLARSGDVRGAEEHFRKAIAGRAVYAEAWSNLGGLYADAGRVADAEAALQTALRIDPGFAKAHNNMARTLAARQQLPEALRHALRAVQLEPDSVESRYNLGQLLQATSLLNDAIREYRHVLRLQPNMAAARLALGAALADLGQMDAAIEEFRETLKRAPDNPDAQRLLAMATAAKQGAVR